MSKGRMSKGRQSKAIEECGKSALGRSTRGLQESVGSQAAASPPLLVGWGQPFLADGNWDQPQYYETIRYADIDGDGQAELLARGPGGFQAYHFDKNLGEWRPQYFDQGAQASQFNPDYQWLPMPSGPALSDALGWDQPQYYQTFRVGDVDGDGLDELVGRFSDGVHVWKWSPGGWNEMQSTLLPCPDSGTGSNNPDGTQWGSEPWYYDTIELAVLDRSDIGSASRPLAYLVARASSGIQVWRWNISQQVQPGWALLQASTLLDDAGRWFEPQYWETIRYGDIDDDGLGEIVFRSDGGMQAYKWYQGQWTPLNPTTQRPFPTAYFPYCEGPPFIGCPNPASTSVNNPDSTPWEMSPVYFGTIRIADVDGDGKLEFLGRGVNGVQGWRAAVTQSGDSWQIGFSLMTTSEGSPAYLDALSDNEGWNLVQYSDTIRFGAINPGLTGPGGQPLSQLMGRGGQGVQTWRWAADTGAPTGNWQQVGSTGNPPWADNGLTGPNPTPGANANWQNAQYYNTIQMADVDGDGAPELLGRDVNMVETWKFNSGASAWARPNVPFPDLSSNPYYAQISQQLSGTTDLRGQYDQVDGATLGQWFTILLLWQTIPPDDISPADPNWQAAVDELLLEVQWAGVVFGLLNVGNGLMRGWIENTLVADQGWLDMVNCHLQLQPSTGNVNATIIQAITSALWAVSALIPGVGEAEIAVAAVVTGLMASGATLLNLSGPAIGNPAEVAFLDLAARLNLSFGGYVNQLAGLKTAVMQDYGLLRIIGGQTAWDDALQTQMSEQASEGYRNWIWRVLTAVAWNVQVNQFELPQNYPPLYAVTLPAPPHQGPYYGWIGVGSHGSFPPKSSLDAVFSSNADSCVPWVNGLNVPVSDAIYALNGWQLPGSPPHGYADDLAVQFDAPRPKRQRKWVRIDAEAHAKPLANGQLRVSLTLVNRGVEPLANVELTSVQFRRPGSRPHGLLLSALSRQQHHLTQGKWATEYLAFTAPGRLPKGQRHELEVKGKFAGGTFTGRVRFAPGPSLLDGHPH